MPTAKLATDLSNDDRKALTVALTDALDEDERVKAEAAEKAGEYREQRKGLEKRIHELKEQIKSGRGEIEVEVDERPGASGVIDLFRKGTDEKVGERPMRSEDRQMSLVSDAPATDEQTAATPAEAEKMRVNRLRAEHGDRILQWMSDAKENVRTQELDGGGWLALLQLEPVDGGSANALREQGETEDEARKKILDLYASTLPKFEEPQPTWDEVAAASAAQQDATAAEVVDGAPLEPAAAVPPDDAPKTLLTPPKGKKAKRHKVVVPGSDKPVDLDEAVAAAENFKAPKDGHEGAAASLDAGDAGAELSETSDGPPFVPVLCTPDCEMEHEHTEERTAF